MNFYLISKISVCLVLFLLNIPRLECSKLAYGNLGNKQSVASYYKISNEYKLVHRREIQQDIKNSCLQRKCQLFFKKVKWCNDFVENLEKAHKYGGLNSSYINNLIHLGRFDHPYNYGSKFVRYYDYWELHSKDNGDFVCQS